MKTLQAAADSVVPFCPVFQSCGGCDWQHVPYAKQLEWKRQFIESALYKSARLTLPAPVVVRPSAEVQNFRNRIKLKARVYQGRFEFGYFAKGSHNLIRIESCPIAETSINELMTKLRSLVLPTSLSWDGELEIQRIGEDEGRCLLHFNPEFPDATVLEKVLPHDAINPTESVLFERHDQIAYRTRAGQFQQVNRKGNHDLREWIKTKVVQIKPKTLLDLYCGSGNLSLGLRSIDAELKVWGLEFSESAIKTAVENLRENKISNFVYRSGPANEIRQLMEDLPISIDCVITDPPRQGMNDALEDILALKPKHILSVSCDPNTFARDLKILLERGYRIRELSGIDFFPQSYHVETLAHLEWDPAFKASL